MSKRFPYFGIGGNQEAPELVLEPGATDAEVTRTIATLIELHLNGSTPEQVTEFWRHSMLPLVAGLMVGTVGQDDACAMFEAMPKWTRDVLLFEDAKPAGPAH